MIIRSKTPGVGIIDMDFKTKWKRGSRRDTHETTYIQNTDPIRAEVERLKKETDNGFTHDRTMQHVASIPILVWLNHPEFAKDSRTIDKWLRTEEGKQFRIARGV